MLHINKKRILSSCLILMLSLVALFPCRVTINASEDRKYIPGGIPFGVKLYSEGPYVSGFIDSCEFENKINPAQNAGIKPGDIIYSVDDKRISDSGSLTEAIKKARECEIKLKIKRENHEEIIAVTPNKCKDGNYRLGINLKDSIAGIGTITYYCPNDGKFGGLGHGICDSNTGSVIPIKKGEVYTVAIKNVIKGTKGIAGEIRGAFTGAKTGTIDSNTERGVFGILSKNFVPITEPLPVAQFDKIKEGAAKIICTLDSSGPQYYDISIVGIEKDKSQNTRNFVIKITDKDLISKTGGIIQGMSGSPIIQNNMLIGAVTHVMLNEPTMGYGIYIDYMLKETQANEVGLAPTSFAFM